MKSLFRFYDFVLLLFTIIFLTVGLTMPQIKNQDNSNVEAVNITVIYIIIPIKKDYRPIGDFLV
jgi:hypothetical protein